MSVYCLHSSQPEIKAHPVGFLISGPILDTSLLEVKYFLLIFLIFLLVTGRVLLMKVQKRLIMGSEVVGRQEQRYKEGVQAKSLRVSPRKLMLLRFDRNLTQLELAQEAGVSPDTISRWETGKTHRAYPSALNKVARVFGIQATELLES